MMTDEEYRRWVYDRAQITMNNGRIAADAVEDGYCDPDKLGSFSREELVSLRDSLENRPCSSETMDEIDKQIKRVSW